MKQLKFLILSPILATFAFYSTHAMEENLSERQQQWAKYHTVANNAISVVDTNMHSLDEFSKLSLCTLPHPEVYHLYLRDNEGISYSLVRDSRTYTTKFIRLYNEVNTQGEVTERVPNYVTMSSPSSRTPKETLVTPTSKLYKAKESHPTVASTSYPTGVDTYYRRINGKKIRFDQGHGIPHADTLIHQVGKISTKDAENYVPQNIKYNSPIRRDLEKTLRINKVSYKEICIFHNDCMYDVTDLHEATKYRIPMPEGFLLITYDETKEIRDTYYFPNFIDYEASKSSRSPKYGHFPELYKIPGLSDWFFNPEVTLGNVSEHQDQIEKASKLSNTILLLSQTLFSRFTEQQMPPKARSALLTTLLEWNVETAASLEFLSFSNQLNLAYFYLDSRRSLWELDDRYQVEKENSVQVFLRDQSVSPTAHELVLFLNSHLDFMGVQLQLQKIVRQFEETYRNAPFRWEVPDLYSTTILTARNGGTHTFNIAKISLLDIPKFKRIIGGVSSTNLPRSQYILSIIDARARQMPSSILEKLHMMRLYHDNNGLDVAENHTYWERAILEQMRNDKEVTLLDRRRVADYYSYRRLETEKAFWLGQFVSYILENPTFENFFLIGNWCIMNRSAFLQDLAEEGDPNIAANMLALQIYKGIRYRCPEVYEERCADCIDHLQEGFGYYKRDGMGVVRANILHPMCLDVFGVNGGTGLKLKRLSYIFLRSLFSKNLEYLYAKVLPQNEFEEVLTKKSADYRDEAAFYLKLGLQDEAQCAARSCYEFASSSFEFKEAALVLQKVGFKELAQAAALQSLDFARIYNDYIYAAEAFDKLGQENQKQVAKQKCFQAIEKDYDFVCAAVEFYKLGLPDLAREAANMNYQRAKESKDLDFAIHIFQQDEMFEMAKEAAIYSFKIAKTVKDFECITKSFNYIGLPTTTSVNFTGKEAS